MDYVYIYGLIMMVLGGLLGSLFTWLWLKTQGVPSTQGAAYDACEDERVMDHDARAMKLLNSCDFL